MSLAELGGGDVPDPSGGLDEANLTTLEVRPVLDELLDELELQQAQVIRLHYFEGANLAQVAKRLSMSRSWVSRLHARGIARLIALVDQRGLHFHDLLEMT